MWGPFISEHGEEGRAGFPLRPAVGPAAPLGPRGRRRGESVGLALPPGLKREGEYFLFLSFFCFKAKFETNFETFWILAKEHSLQ